MNNEIEFLVKNNCFIKFFESKKLAITKSQRDLLRKTYKDNLSSSKHKKTIIKNKSSYKDFYYYWKDDDLGTKVIACDFLVGSKDILDITAEVSKLDQRVKTIQFFLAIRSKEYKKLLKSGARSAGIHYIAKTTDGLKYLKTFDYEDLSFKYLSKNNFSDVVNIEYRATQNDKSSRMGNLTKKSVESLFKWLSARKKTKTFVAYQDGIAVGCISISINSFNNAHIMNVSVLPSYQGLGISKYLYYLALSYMHKMNVRTYSGVTTTTRVISLSKRLKRIGTMAYVNIHREKVSGIK